MLSILLEKALGLYIAKEEQNRKCDAWEMTPLSPELSRYAALDVYASQLIFERTVQISPIPNVAFDTAPGTSVILLAHEGGLPIAYSTVSDPQPAIYHAVQVDTQKPPID